MYQARIRVWVPPRERRQSEAPSQLAGTSEVLSAMLRLLSIIVDRL